MIPRLHLAHGLLAAALAPGLAQAYTPLDHGGSSAVTLVWYGDVKRGLPHGTSELRYTHRDRKTDAIITKLELRATFKKGELVGPVTGTVTEASGGTWCPGDTVEGTLSEDRAHILGRATVEFCGGGDRQRLVFDWVEGRLDIVDGPVDATAGQYSRGSMAYVDDTKAWAVLPDGSEFVPYEADLAYRELQGKLSEPGVVTPPEGEPFMAVLDEWGEITWRCLEGDCQDGEGVAFFDKRPDYPPFDEELRGGTWRGGFKDGKMHGTGTFTDRDGLALLQTWRGGYRGTPSAWKVPGGALVGRFEDRYRIDYPDGAVLEVLRDGQDRVVRSPAPPVRELPTLMWAAAQLSELDVIDHRTCLGGPCSQPGAVHNTKLDVWVEDGDTSMLYDKDQQALWIGRIDEHRNEWGDGLLCTAQGCEEAVFRDGVHKEGFKSLAELEAREAATAQAAAEREARWAREREADRQARARRARAGRQAEAARKLVEAAIEIREFPGEVTAALGTQEEGTSWAQMAAMSAEDGDWGYMQRASANARQLQDIAFARLVGARDNIDRALQLTAQARRIGGEIDCLPPELGRAESALATMVPTRDTLRRMYRTETYALDDLERLAGGFDGDAVVRSLANAAAAMERCR